VAVNLVRAHAEVAGVPALHPDFDEADALKQVENRYRRIQAEFPFTLQQLTKDAVFLVWWQSFARRVGRTGIFFRQ